MKHKSKFTVEIKISGQWEPAGEIVLSPATYNGATDQDAIAAVQAQLVYDAQLQAYVYGGQIIPKEKLDLLRVVQGAAWSEPDESP